jgi:hypothetical protein
MEFETEEQYLAVITEYLSSLHVPPDIIGPLSRKMANEVSISRIAACGLALGFQFLQKLF